MPTLEGPRSTRSLRGVRELTPSAAGFVTAFLRALCRPIPCAPAPPTKTSTDPNDALRLGRSGLPRWRAPFPSWSSRSLLRAGERLSLSGVRVELRSSTTSSRFRARFPRKSPPQIAPRDFESVPRAPGTPVASHSVSVRLLLDSVWRNAGRVIADRPLSALRWACVVCPCVAIDLRRAAIPRAGSIVRVPGARARATLAAGVSPARDRPRALPARACPRA